MQPEVYIWNGENGWIFFQNVLLFQHDAALIKKISGEKQMTLGEKISKQRKELNYTQEQLADILGVSRQSISKWESEISHS